MPAGRRSVVVAWEHGYHCKFEYCYNLGFQTFEPMRDSLDSNQAGIAMPAFAIRLGRALQITAAPVAILGSRLGFGWSVTSLMLRATAIVMMRMKHADRLVSHGSVHAGSTCGHTSRGSM